MFTMLWMYLTITNIIPLPRGSGGGIELMIIVCIIVDTILLLSLYQRIRGKHN